MLIDGRKISAEIIEKLKALPKPQKFLAAVLVGDDPASLSFINQKKKTAEELGIDFRTYKLSEELGNDGLRQEIGRLAKQSACGGLIVQLPLPENLNRRYILNAISREKDVDLLSEKAYGTFEAGNSAMLPPAVGTVEEIVSRQTFSLEDKTVLVLGLGFLVGRPIAAWLKRKTKELTLLDKGFDAKELSRADLVIVGTGEPGLVSPETLKNGAAVIDFGYGNKNGKPMGDLDTKGRELLLWYTPTPGGTGPILVAKLFQNFYSLQKVVSKSK